MSAASLRGFASAGTCAYVALPITSATRCAANAGLAPPHARHRTAVIAAANVVLETVPVMALEPPCLRPGVDSMPRCCIPRNTGAVARRSVRIPSNRSFGRHRYNLHGGTWSGQAQTAGHPAAAWRPSHSVVAPPGERSSREPAGVVRSPFCNSQ